MPHEFWGKLVPPSVESFSAAQAESGVCIEDQYHSGAGLPAAPDRPESAAHLWFSCMLMMLHFRHGWKQPKLPSLQFPGGRHRGSLECHDWIKIIRPPKFSHDAWPPELPVYHRGHEQRLQAAAKVLNIN